MTEKVELLGGVSADMAPQNLITDHQHKTYRKEYLATDNGQAAPIYNVDIDDLIFLVAVTFRKDASGKLISDGLIIPTKDAPVFAGDLRTFVKMIKGGKPVKVWVNHFSSTIPIHFYHSWRTAYHTMIEPITSLAERPGEFLSEDEKKDIKTPE